MARWHRHVPTINLLTVLFPVCSCPYAQRAWIALEELNVPYTTHLIDGSNKDPAFKELYASIVQDPDMPAKVPTIIGWSTPPCLMCTLA